MMTMSHTQWDKGCSLMEANWWWQHRWRRKSHLDLMVRHHGLLQRRSNGVKPSDRIAKLFNKNCTCFTSQVKTGEVIGTSAPYRSARSCRSVLLLPTAPCACFHSVGLLRRESPPSSEVTVSASATSEASGSACKTPKVLPVSSMKRRSSPSAYTERPLFGTAQASASSDITSRALRIVTDPSTFGSVKKL